MNFGGSDLTSAGGIDIFLAKFNANGIHQWSRRFGSTDDDEGIAVAAGSFDNVDVTGYFGGTVNFGGPVLVSAGGPDIFVANFDGLTGNTLWGHRAGNTGFDAGVGVAETSTGGVLVTGFFNGSMSFPGGPVLNSAGAEDIFLARFDALSGFAEFSQRFGSTLSDVPYGITAYLGEEVIVTGSFQGTVDFGGGPLASAGGEDVFVIKYLAVFPFPFHLWSQRFGSTGSDRGSAVATDAMGNVLVTGSFNGNVGFGGGTLSSAGSDDVFLAKYDINGTHLWSQRFGDAWSDAGRSVAVDGYNNVLMTGSFQGTVNFGSIPFTSAGGNDIFIAKYSATGAPRWSQQRGDASDDTGYDVSVYISGDAVVTGDFADTVDFGGGGLTSAGATDVYLARYTAAANRPYIVSISDVGNDQGRRVKIRFVRSGEDDAAAAAPIEQYEAFRRSDPLPSSMSELSPPIEDPSLVAGWAFVGAVPAHGEVEYEMLAPTLADSTISQGQYYSTFFIRAATATPSVYYDSPHDSGYSLDNIPPGAPASFAYNSGDLSWDESAAADFDYFTVYGSNTNSFASATLVDHTVAPAMDVTASPYAYYFVTATDFSGNEGPASKLSPFTGLGDTPVRYTLDVNAYPNPFNPGTTVRYVVP